MAVLRTLGLAALVGAAHAFVFNFNITSCQYLDIQFSMGKAGDYQIYMLDKNNHAVKAKPVAELQQIPNKDGWLQARFNMPLPLDQDTLFIMGDDDGYLDGGVSNITKSDSLSCGDRAYDLKSPQFKWSVNGVERPQTLSQCDEIMFSGIPDTVAYPLRVTAAVPGGEAYESIISEKVSGFSIPARARAGDQLVIFIVDANHDPIGATNVYTVQKNETCNSSGFASVTVQAPSQTTEPYRPPSVEAKLVAARKQQQTSGLSKGAIAGICVGAILGVLLLVVVGGLLCWRRRKARRQYSPPGSFKTDGDGHGDGVRRATVDLSESPHHTSYSGGMRQAHPDVSPFYGSGASTGRPAHTHSDSGRYSEGRDTLGADHTFGGTSAWETTNSRSSASASTTGFTTVNSPQNELATPPLHSVNTPPLRMDVKSPSGTRANAQQPVEPEYVNHEDGGAPEPEPPQRPVVHVPPSYEKATSAGRSTHGHSDAGQ